MSGEGVQCGCHRYAMAHTLNRVRARIAWWQTDLATPLEQIDRGYVVRLLHDLEKAADGVEQREVRRRS